MFGQDLLQAFYDLISGNPMKHSHSRAEFMPKCDKCHLHMCAHRRGEGETTETISSSTPSALSLGEEVASDLVDVAGTRFRVAAPKDKDTGVPVRTIIPPPAVSISPIMDVKDAPNVGSKSEGSFPSPKSDKTYSQGWEKAFGDKDKKSKSKDDGVWMECSICSCQANIRYFDEHMKVHTIEFDKKLGGKAEPSINDKVRKALATIPKQLPAASETSKKSVIPKINNLEKHKFRKIERAVACASRSTSGRYSDFTVMFVLENKPAAYSNAYTGSQPSIYRDFERLNVHVVHDARDDFYTVSVKTVKRSAHASYDTDDSPVPERICYQDELAREIRAAMLFIGVDPKSAYRHFRRMIRDNVVSELDDTGRVLVSCTNGYVAFTEAMKKNGTNQWSRDNSNMYDHGGCG